MSKLTKHLKTVHIHRKEVRKACFKMGIIWQGLTHDLSKYSLKELFIAKYYSGKGSPHQVCREAIGYSPSWIHHYHKNKHHWQYWLDDDENTGRFTPIKMPYKYVIEMFCDMVGAGKAYMKNKWTCASPWEYYEAKCRGKRTMHSQSIYLLEKLFWNLKEYGEEYFYKWYKHGKSWLKEKYIAGAEDY